MPPTKHVSLYYSGGDSDGIEERGRERGGRGRGRGRGRGETDSFPSRFPLALPLPLSLPLSPLPSPFLLSSVSQPSPPCSLQYTHLRRIIASHLRKVGSLRKKNRAENHTKISSSIRQYVAEDGHFRVVIVFIIATSFVQKRMSCHILLVNNSSGKL